MGLHARPPKTPPAVQRQVSLLPRGREARQGFRRSEQCFDRIRPQANTGIPRLNLKVAAIRLKRDEDEFYSLQGRALVELGRPDSAVESFARARQLAPPTADAAVQPAP